MSTSVASRREQGWLVLVPLAYALSVTVYTALRYGYRWAETDTGAFMRLVHRILETQTIEPPTSAYPNGYGYQSLVIVLSDVTGLREATLQIVVLPFLSLVIALTAFVTMRLLTGSATLGAASALLLFIQPEFLFVVQRGNHEKVTYLLVLLLVFLISISIIRPCTRGSLIAAIVAYYLCLWALISTTSFFASTFLVALGMTVVGGWVMMRIARARVGNDSAMRRLVYTLLAGGALILAFIVIIYEPAQHTILLYEQLIDQLSVLLLSAETTGEPYAAVGTDWAAPWLYPVLSAFNWLVLATSALAWAGLVKQFRREGINASNRNVLVLCMLAAALALQVALSIFVDLAGFLSANLQVRLFPFYMLFGIPLAVVGVSRLIGRLSGAAKSAASVAITLALFVFAIAGVLKATNDPLVSNKWLFFTHAEEVAVAWVDRSMIAQDIWLGQDERLRMMQDIHNPADPSHTNRYVEGSTDPSMRYFVVSTVTEWLSIRRKVPLPAVAGEDRIYDNGTVQVYHRVPETPYQP